MTLASNAARVFVAIGALLSAYSSTAGVLFQKPLHLTRQIDDPISGRSSSVDEYDFASRVVTIAGGRTIIADYESSELTEIDRSRGTFSTTSFASIAQARPHRSLAGDSDAKRIQRIGADRRAGRLVDLFSGDDSGAKLHADIAVDATLSLSRDAFDAIAGAAHPNDGGPVADLARAAARKSVASNAEEYGLPLDQTVRWEVGGKVLTSRNRVVRVGNELPPADLLAIPAGARRVDSHIVRTAREADRLDARPSSAKTRQP